jgi:hypothetical protein
VKACCDLATLFTIYNMQYARMLAVSGSHKNYKNSARGKSVLGICDILVRIQIWGSVSLIQLQIRVFSSVTLRQCSGSASGSGSTGSTCFLASRIRIHASEVWIRIRIRLWIRIRILSSCKNNKKNLESYYFCDSF